MYLKLQQALPWSPADKPCGALCCGPPSPNPGNFTAAQARKAGYSYQAQYHHVTHGNWLKIDRGLFRLAEFPVGIHEDLVRWSLWAGPNAVISHESALDVHKIGEFNPSRVHLTLPRQSSKQAGGVVIHYGLLDHLDVAELPEFRVTTPIRSLIDTAAAGVDADHLERAIDDASKLGLLTIRQLRERAEEVDLRGALRIEQALGRLGV